MENGPTHKVRLVRCPKCLMLLPEPTGILVYKCGGCETVLQVKNRKNDANGTTPGREAAQMKEVNRVYEVGECSSSSQKAVHRSSSECCLDQNEGVDQRVCRDNDSEVGECSSSSQKAVFHSSGECSLEKNEGRCQRISGDHVPEGGESSSHSEKATLPSSAECSLDQNGGGNQKIPRDHVYEVGERSSSSQTAILRSSGECSLDQNEGGHQRISRDHVSEGGESSNPSGKATLPSSAEYSLDQNRGGDQKISRDHVSECEESSSASQIAILTCSGECSLDQNDGGDQKIYRDHISEGGECSLDQNDGGDQKIYRDHISEGGESSSSSQIAIHHSSGECSLGQNGGGHQRMSRDHVSEGEESSSPSGKATLPSTAEYSLDQNRGGDLKISRDHVSEGGESSNSSQIVILPCSGECSLDQSAGGDQKISRDLVSEGGESSCSSQIAIFPSSGECSFDQNGGGDQKISRDHVSEGGESSCPSGKATLPSSAEYSLEQNRGEDQKLSRDHVSEGGESNSSSQIAIIPSSGECSLDQNDGEDQKISRDHVSEGGESSSSNQIAIRHSSGECSFDQNGGGDQNISGDCSTENSEDVNSLDGDRNNVCDHNESQVCNIKQPGVSNEFCSSNGGTYLENEELSQFARTKSEVGLNEMSSLQAGAKSAVDINSESDSTVRSSTANNMARRENNSTVTSHKLAAARFSSDILLSSPDEQPKQRQMNVNLSYERRDFCSPRSEVRRKTENYKAKSPRFRSSYEYDGSISSYDGTTDDQVPDQHMNLHRSAFKAPNSVMYEEQSRRENFQGNSIRNGNSEMQHQARNLSSASPDTRPYTTDYRKWGGDELLGSTGYGLPDSNGTRLQDDEFPSPLPFHQMGYPAGYESCSTSSLLQDEFHHSSSEQERFKLLRMVYELKDRINKTCHVNGNANRRVSTGVTGKEKYIPAQYSGEIPEDEFFHDLNYHRYPERWRQVRNWPHQHKVSHIPFSGESTDSRQHVNRSCMHCYPQDLQSSAPLPPPFLSLNKGVRRFHFHPGHNCYNTYSSHPSSPQHFADSEFIWHRETKSDHQRHEDHHMKEKHHLVKRHLRPTAGGAPFITCYNCLNPLQLPADFLVFKRRFHLLRCGACSKVLKYSLERRTHIVPYTPAAATPPPSQLDEYNDAVNRMNSVSSSCGNGCSAADPVSCSDDYGQSHCKSYSTDGDPVILATFHNGRGNTGGRNLSYDSSKSMKERPQLVRKQPGSKYKNPVETQASPGPSSNKSRSEKVSSEIEELPAKGSPLHRLMGYSSPSQVLRGFDPSYL